MAYFATPKMVVGSSGKVLFPIRQSTQHPISYDSSVKYACVCFPPSYKFLPSSPAESKLCERKALLLLAVCAMIFLLIEKLSVMFN